MLVLLAVLGSVSSFAQSNPNEEQGLRPYDSFHGGDLDSVSLTNGALAGHIPLVSFPQRGQLDLSFSLRFSSKQWQVKQRCVRTSSTGVTCTYSWIVARGDAGAQVVSSVDWRRQSTAINVPDPSGGGTTAIIEGVVSPDGSLHQLGGAGTEPNGTTGALVYPIYSKDATGIYVPDINDMVLPNGTHYYYPSVPQNSTLTVPQGIQPSTITDADGNQITIGSGGWTDTMGRVIPGSSAATGLPVQSGVPTSDLSNCPPGIASAMVWNVPGVASVNAGVRTFKLCYSSVAIATNFQQQGVTEFNGNLSLLTAIVLPDLTMWTLTYDNYGNVAKIGLPAGGSISYTYTTSATASCTDPFQVDYTAVSRWVTSRTVDANDGTGPHIWNYSYVNGKTTVTDPNGNDTVHIVTIPVQNSCSLYDTQVKSYQGSSANGTLLRTVSTQYTGTTAYWLGAAINVVPVQATTSSPGGQTSKLVNTYDGGGSDPNGDPYVLGRLLQKDEYDYSNTLVRSTLNHYVWQDNAIYKNNNLLSLVASATIKDGSGNQLSHTDYYYDQTAVISSGIATGLVASPGANIRGHVTSVSRWLNTANSFISSSATYFNTGAKASSTDPLGHITSYTYSSTFTGAYLTQTNLPDTQMPDMGAAVVHHVISGNYDFNTGLLTSFSDENGQTYSYQYDNMLRLTQGNHPDGGQTTFNYPSPIQVERQRLISGTTYDDFKVNFDGLGRPIQSQQIAPSGTILADTIYDSDGRVASVSNPYYQGSNHSTDLIYGVTQTQFDALGRAIKNIKQDGSFSTAAYNTAPGDGAGTSVICSTATDEAGKQRQACTDALGRLVKILEPNPGSTPTTATGWIAVGGSEQTSSPQPAASGHGSVTISGSESSAILDPCADAGTGSCPHTVWDRGSVSITVNGHTNSVSYGQQDTPSTLASALVSAINGDSVASVTASLSGATLNITAKTTGTSTNYAFTTSSSTNDVTDFGAASFAVSPASGALTGGHNATTGTQDTGTVTATINGTQYSVTYGSGDTASSIAGHLATAISAGSYASASASGATVNLTSKTAGPAGNYSVSASWTWNSGQFANPSFTPATSGSNLAGGYNAGDLNNHPYVTTYQYDPLGNLLCVHQKATDTSADVACTGSAAPSVPAAWRQRFFIYDSLSRLVSAFNPESGLTSYGYDNNGNLTSKTSPAPNQTGTATVTTTITYDALNRQLDKSYSDGVTLGSSLRYDSNSAWGASIQNPIGRIVLATTGGGVTADITSYDSMGRVAQVWQSTPGVGCCPTMTASYDQLGDLTTLAYPTGSFNVSYGYDIAARLISATDSKGVTYAQNPTFLPSGAIQEFVSPNFSNNKFHTDYNNRLQPTETWAGPAQGATVLFDKQYSYNAPNTSQMNNGNVYTVTNVKDDSRTQSFTYDALNRLLSAGDKTHWSNIYLYDAWGNLYQKNPGTPAGEYMVKNADANNRLSGVTYDATGNVTNDGLGNTFVYDAENRIISVANGGVTTNYVYDPYGRRIKKSTSSAVTNYWYGPGGEILAETDANANWTNYVFFGGQRLARNIPQPSPNPADIKYYVTDHLHSTAVFADKNGSVLDDNDFYPWGGVVPGVGTTGSNNHYKFTGKERDTESGLDYFGARYYANITGRFMSPDWAAKPTSVPYAEFGDPQSLNLYSYVRNSPVVRVDADGHTAAILDTPTLIAGHGGLGDPGGEDDDRYDVTTITHKDGTVTQQIQKVGSSDILYNGAAFVPVKLNPRNANNARATNLANRVYNETGGLYVRPGVEGFGNAQDLHNARVAVAEIALRNSAVAGSSLTESTKKALRGKDPNTLAAYNDSLAAAHEALNGSNSTQGARHFFLLKPGVAPGTDQSWYPDWAKSIPVASFGLFGNRGGGDVGDPTGIIVIR